MSGVHHKYLSFVINRIECWKLSVLANTAVAINIFTLIMATAVITEVLDNSQHSTWIILKSWSFTIQYCHFNGICWDWAIWGQGHWPENNIVISCVHSWITSDAWQWMNTARLNSELTSDRYGLNTNVLHSKMNCHHLYQNYSNLKKRKSLVLWQK